MALEFFDSQIRQSPQASDIREGIFGLFWMQAGSRIHWKQRCFFPKSVCPEHPEPLVHLQAWQEEEWNCPL